MALAVPRSYITNPKAYPAAKVAIMVEALKEIGIEPLAVLRGSGIDIADLTTAVARLNIEQVLAVYSNAARLTHDPNFPFRTGLRFHISAYGMYGFAILGSADFRQTMKIGVQYHRLATPVVQIHFTETQRNGIWTVIPILPAGIQPDLSRFLVELQYGHLTALHRDVMGSAFIPLELQFAFPKPRARAAFEEISGRKISFGCSENRMIFDGRFLEGPAPLGNPITHQSVLAICDAMLSELELSDGIAGEVREALLANLGHDMSLTDVSEKLGIPARTLRRRLQQAGTSYRKIADDLRTQLAVKYLRDSELTVEEIASALAFSDAANFRQAFRRWTGKSPSRLRRR